MKYFTLFIFLSVIQYYKCVTNFILNLSQEEELCLDEYFSDKTLVIYEISTEFDKIDVKLYDPTDKVMFAQRNIKKFKESFTTFNGGYYQICITNGNEKEAKVNFDLKYGVAAKDYSAVAKVKDLKPVEVDLQKLDDKSKELYHLMSYANAHEKIFENIQDSITSKITFFSVILIAIMIVVGLLETFYLKRSVFNRKNI